MHKYDNCCFRCAGRECRYFDSLEVKGDEVKGDEVKRDEVKADEVKADEVKGDEGRVFKRRRTLVIAFVHCFVQSMFR